MNLSDLSIRRPVFATVISLLLIVLGVMAFTRLTLRELPAIDPPIVSVDVTYPGASAGVVETRVTQILEDALSGIEGIETIESRSINGRASISIEFNLSRDIEAAANDVRDSVSRVSNRMPEEADPAQIEKVEADSDPILWLNMSSTQMDTLQLSDYAERYVVEWLNSQVAGGYVDYHAVSGTYELSPEHAAVLADEDSPVYMPHAWQITASMWMDEDKTIEAFRRGAGGR